MAIDDELLNRVTWKIPNALALVGSRAGDERNAMTTSWITQLSMEPVLIGVGVDNSAVTHRLITDGGSFTVNLWDAEDTRVFVKFSKPATAEGDTLNGRPVRTATTGAPVFDEAIAWMDCEVRHTLDLGSHTLFVGEVVDVAIRDDEARSGVDERHPHEVRRRQAPLTLRAAWPASRGWAAPAVTCRRHRPSNQSDQRRPRRRGGHQAGDIPQVFSRFSVVYRTCVW